MAADVPSTATTTSAAAAAATTAGEKAPSCLTRPSEHTAEALSQTLLQADDHTIAWNLDGWTDSERAWLLRGALEERSLAGVQLVAAYGREDVLFRVAAQLEQARPWAHHRPTV
jgi:Asp-tRNA(Asn)/Glu-tRNA(Gln) amidotransferase A subunit family amidase